jgi:hypothetical protein
MGRGWLLTFLSSRRNGGPEVTVPAADRGAGDGSPLKSRELFENQGLEKASGPTRSRHYVLLLSTPRESVGSNNVDSEQSIYGSVFIRAD